MSKITRYNGNLKAFASEATGTERTIFGDTAQSDTLDANITLDLLRGWGVIGVESNPTKQHFNGLAFTLGQLIAYLHQQGVPEWNAAQEYYAGSVVTTLAGIYRLKSGGVGSSDPDTDGGVNWELIPTQAKVDGLLNDKVSSLLAAVPAGVIMAYSPGFFTDGSNGGFTTGLSANTIAAANTELYPTWRVCDGSYLNDSSSMYFNGSGRYVPNLTDDRFIMGDTACGNIGGTSTMAHIHSMSHNHGSFSTDQTTISTSQMPSHSHNTRTHATGVDPSGTTNVLGTDLDGYDTATTGGGGSHNHYIDSPHLSAVTGPSTITENRPRFLSTFYIIKVR